MTGLPPRCIEMLLTIDTGEVLPPNYRLRHFRTLLMAPYKRLPLIVPAGFDAKWSGADLAACWLPRTETGKLRAPDRPWMISLGRREMPAHRWMYQWIHDIALSPAQVVRHRCPDARSCCNPAHLIAGTIGQNNADRHTQRTGGWISERPNLPGGWMNMIALHLNGWSSEAERASLLAYVMRRTTPDANGCRCLDGWTSRYRSLSLRLDLADPLTWESLGHRAVAAAYAGWDGRSPRPEVVEHLCDVKGCLEPSHLIASTAADNLAAAIERRRHPRGSSHPNSVATPELKVEIRRWVRAGRSQSSCARALGISKSAIYNIVTRPDADVDPVEPPITHRRTHPRTVRDRVVAHARATGDPTSVVAGRFGLPAPTVRGWLRGEGGGREAIHRRQDRIRMHVNHGLTNHAIAELEGVSDSYVSMIRNGHRGRSLSLAE
jgi:transposase-like protein